MNTVDITQAVLVLYYIKTLYMVVVSLLVG